jgi:hypothetical protein
MVRGGLNTCDVADSLIIWLAILVYLMAVLLTVDLYIRLRRARSELERIIKIIEEIERMNRRDD